jgi:hypothetical protein
MLKDTFVFYNLVLREVKMQIEKLNFSHQLLLKDRLFRADVDFSEYSFANLYLFREIHQYQLLTFQKEIFIQGLTRDKIPFILLTAPPDEESITLLKQFFQTSLTLFPVPGKWLPALSSYIIGKEYKEEDSDYLYAIDKLAHYSIPNLHKKYRSSHHFSSEYLSFAMVPLNEKNQQDALQTLENWQKEHAVEEQVTDYQSCKEAIEKISALSLHGNLLYVDHIPIAVGIREWIKPEYYFFYFCKALRGYKGVYPFFYQHIAQSIESKTKWINLQQDLGIPGLRLNKQSYAPDQLLCKWRVKI